MDEEDRLVDVVMGAVENLRAAKGRQMDNLNSGAGPVTQGQDERLVQWWEDALAQAAGAWRDFRVQRLAAAK